MDPLIGRVLLDRYEVLRRIGSGGMGAVYAGRQPAVGREVALKILRADLMANEHVRQRFRREAEIIGRLNHPNTIQLIDYGENSDGLAVMVMELLLGQALNERLKTKGPLSVPEVITLGRQMVGSLAEAHLIGLVHRDLKPANIFLTEVGTQVHAKVLDFGIARLLDEEATRLTSTGQVFGTPRYMSPEQAMSTADVDPRSDLYSFGLILYECLVGQPPFVAQTSIQYLSAHTTQAPPLLRQGLPGAPAALEELIDACLEKEPEDRPQTADEVSEVLAAIQRSLDFESGSGTQPIVVPRGRSQLATEASAPADTVADTALSPPPPRTRPVDTIDVPGGNSKPNWIPIAIGVVFALAAAVVVAIGLFGPWRTQPAPVVNSGLLEAVALKPEDAGARIDVAVDTGVSADAGILLDATLPLDAGIEAPEDASVAIAVIAKPDAGKKRRRRRKPVKKGDDNQAGQGAIQGPRGMMIAVDEDEDDVLDIASRCKTSVFSGLSKLTVKSCPKNCAIVVDEQCAGRTPAVDRAISPGYRTITVVCSGKVRRTSSLRFAPDDTTTFKCR